MHQTLWCDPSTTFKKSRARSHAEHHIRMGTRLVLDAALMAAAYCGVSIAYQARDAIFGLVLLASSSGVSVSVAVNNELY